MCINTWIVSKNLLSLCVLKSLNKVYIHLIDDNENGEPLVFQSLKQTLLCSCNGNLKS